MGTIASGVVSLDHNYGTADALSITQVPDPQNYRLFLFLSADWLSQKRSVNDALAASQLDLQGRWVSPIVVLPNTYHIVVRKPGSLTVAFPNLLVHL